MLTTPKKRLEGQRWRPVLSLAKHLSATLATATLVCLLLVSAASSGHGQVPDAPPPQPPAPPTAASGSSSTPPLDYDQSHVLPDLASLPNLEVEHKEGVIEMGAYPTLEGMKVIKESCVIRSQVPYGQITLRKQKLEPDRAHFKESVWPRGPGVVAYFIKNAFSEGDVQRWTTSFENIPKINSSRYYAAGPVALSKLHRNGDGYVLGVDLPAYFKANHEQYEYKGSYSDRFFAYRKEGLFVNDHGQVLKRNKDGKVVVPKKENNRLRSVSLGFSSNTNKIGQEPFWQTSTSTNKAKFKNEVVPYFEAVSDVYRRLLPAEYDKNMALINEYQCGVGRSAFSICAFNKGMVDHADPKKNIDSQTAVHLDSSHWPEVTDVFVVLGRPFTGGELVFPEYGFALQLAPGDAVFMNGAKDLHGNTPLLSGMKFSTIFHIHQHHLTDHARVAFAAARSAGSRQDADGDFTMEARPGSGFEVDPDAAETFPAGRPSRKRKQRSAAAAPSSRPASAPTLPLEAEPADRSQRRQKH